MASTQFRSPYTYDTFYIDHTTRVRFAIYQMLDGVRTPYDASTPTSWALQFYAADTDASLDKSVTLTVQAETTDGVTNIIQGDVLLANTDVAVGTSRAKLVCVISGNPHIVEKPWVVNIYEGGPTS